MMEDIYMIENHLIRGGEGISDKINWQGKHEIKNYNLHKFKVFNFVKNPYDYISTSNMGYLDMIAHSIEKKMWDEFNEKATDFIIRKSHDKHPSTFKDGIKKLVN